MHKLKRISIGLIVLGVSTLVLANPGDSENVREIDKVLEAGIVDAALDDAREAEEIRLAEEAARKAEADRLAAEAAKAERLKQAALAKARANRKAAAPRYAGPIGDDIWSRLAFCESGGRTNAVSRSGKYFGAFQFSLATWRSVGGPGNPIDHDYGTQLHYAKILQARSGWGQWPTCARRLGLI